MVNTRSVAPDTLGLEYRTSSSLLWIFAAAIFLNASLLFVVQPMFTKLVLPLLGGTPAVWNTCLVFFQGALLVGYLYAHVSSKLSPVRQGVLHLILLGVGLLFLPLGIPAEVAPPVGNVMPIGWLLWLLTTSLGVPFVLLAAGAPMLQRWFAVTDHPQAANPYVLYVASNIGSFAALLLYPLVIEPQLRLGQQRVAWMYGYGFLGTVIVGALYLALRNTRGERQAESAQVSVDGPAPTLAMTDEPTLVPTAAWRVRWVLLSFAPSSLLLGVTSYLSTDVAAMPLLWVVPLAIYLFTFVLVFAQRPPLNKRMMLWIQLYMGLALLVIIGMTPTRMKALHVAVHLIGFFAAAMVCHRELADSRPRARYLTEFYLWMSLGGLLGGVYNALLAPVLYERVLEYPYALIIAFGLRPLLTEYKHDRRSMLLDLALPAVLYAVLWQSFKLPVPDGPWGTGLLWTVLTIAALAAASFHKRPLRLALAAAALFVAVDKRTAEAERNLIYQTRSFFGVYKVARYTPNGEDRFMTLQSGTTTHGAQRTNPGRTTELLTYYTPQGPLGDVFATIADTVERRHVAVVGLGTGTTACYSRSDERWDYYEIDPAVVTMAASGRLFSFIKECAPDANIVLGDARISLRTAPDSSYDLILLDAFSSDAIPVHLMTQEALQLYLSKLKPGGAIVFHISNRYLALEPVLVELARDARLAGASRLIDATLEERRQMQYSSRWVAMARSAATLGQLTKEREWQVLAPSADVRLWTDDYSDVLGALAVLK